MTRRVVVVGAGITGLVAARRIAAVEGFEVVCLEASERVGGQLRTVELDGAKVDVGAEAIHLGTPHVASLVRELGLDASVVAAAPGSSVMATRKGLRPLPAGVGPTGPTKIWPVLKSGILTIPGLVRAGLEPVMARRRFAEDLPVGAFTRRRFGAEVTDTFVDPLLGNLHGGDVHRLSLRATAPQLLPAAEQGRSMLLGNLKLPAPVAKVVGRVIPELAPKPARPGRSGSALPMFASWPDGLGTLTDALTTQSRATIRTNAAVRGLERSGDGWRVLLDHESIEADHVLLTVPAEVGARLLEGISPEAVELYRGVPTASVATVVLGWERDEVRDNPTLRDANGILLPNKRVRTFKALTNLGRKWPGLDTRHHLVRASVGRIGTDLADELDDEAMTTRVAHEIAELTGLQAEPRLRQVHRWPRSMPQLELGHLQRVAAARSSLESLGGISIAGCSVDGLGIGATVRSANQAAERIVNLHTPVQE